MSKGDGRTRVGRAPPFQDGSDLLTRAERKVADGRKIGVAKLSVASNSFLFFFKLSIGLMMGSISVISEGVHSGMDLLAAIIAFYAVKRSSRPADKDHHYGHGKYESISGTAEALLIFVAAALIIYEAVRKFLRMEGVELLEWGILIMLISVVMNTVVSRRLMRVAKETHSIALEADGLHLTTDVWTSAGVMMGLVLIRLTGLHVLDPIVAILVALLIIKAAYDLTKKSFDDLVDSSLPQEEVDTIKAVLDEHDHVIHDYHKLRTRRAGPDRYIDVHIVVSRELGLEETHSLNDHIEREIVDRVPHAHVLIHSEPCDGKCEMCDQDLVCEELRKARLKAIGKRDKGSRQRTVERVRPIICKVLEGHEQVVTFHDIKLARTTEGKRLTLHVIVKAGMTVEQGHDLNHELEKRVQTVHPDMEVIVHLEPCTGRCEECEEDCPEKD